MYLLARMASRCRRRRLIYSSFFVFDASEVTKRISTKLGHIFTYDCYVKIGPNFPGHSPHTGRGQKRFFGTDFELWPKISQQRNSISTIRMKLVNLQGLPYMPSKFGGLFDFFRQIYGGKNSAADSASRIFFGWYSADKIRRLIRIFGGGLGV